MTSLTCTLMVILMVVELKIIYAELPFHDQLQFLSVFYSQTDRQVSTNLHYLPTIFLAMIATISYHHFLYSY